MRSRIDKSKLVFFLQFLIYSIINDLGKYHFMAKSVNIIYVAKIVCYRTFKTIIISDLLKSC